ncbi:MAG: hypothetical protein KDC95_01265 [Planctomycetes bacterium]|nr:hypothetical protein [Planctomycetota bacterium]
MRFKTSFLITLAFQVLILAFDKGAGFVIWWLLGEDAEKAGGVLLLLNLPAILVAIGNLGLAASCVYFVQRKEVSADVAGRSSTTIAIVWGALLAVVLRIVLEIWSRVIPGAELPPWTMLTPMLVLPVFLLVTMYRSYIQLATGRIVAFNVTRLVPSLCFLPLFLLLYFVVTDHDAYHAAAYARFVPGVLVAIGVVFAMRHVIRVAPGFDRRFVGKALGFGWRANVHATLTALNHRVDLYLLGGLYVVATVLPENERLAAMQREVAFYGYAMTIAELIWHFPEALRDILFAKIAGMDEDDASRFTPVVARNSLAIAVVGAALIWFTHAPLLHLMFGASWATTWAPGLTPALFWLLPGTVFYTVAKVLQSDLMARHHLTSCNVATSVVFVMLIGLDFAWIPEQGARGAAMASSVAYLVGAIWTIVVYVRSTPVRLLDVLLVRPGDLVHYRGILPRTTREKPPSTDAASPAGPQRRRGDRGSVP